MTSPDEIVTPSGRLDAERVAESDQRLFRRLAKTKGEIKRVDFCSTLAAMTTVALAILFVGVLLDHLVFSRGLSPRARILFAVVAVLSLAAFFLYRIFPLLKYRINPLYAAEILERSGPGLKNGLINWLLLRRPPDVSETSDMAARENNAVWLETFRRQLSLQTANEVEQIPREIVVDHGPVIRWGIALVAVLAVFSLYSVLAAKNPFISAARIFLPFASIDAPQSVRFLRVEPSGGMFYQGDAVTVRAEVAGAGDSPVFFSWSTADKRLVDQRIPMTPAGYNLYEVPFPASGGLTESVDFRVVVGKDRKESHSAEFRLEVRPAMTFLVEKMALHYPAYTGLVPVEPEHPGNVRALEGTRVDLVAVANVPMSKALFIPDRTVSRAATMTIDPKDPHRASYSFVLRRAAGSERDGLRPEFENYRLLCHDLAGVKNLKNPESEDEGLVYPVEILEDRPPTVRWANSVDGETEIPVDGAFETKVVASDTDFALRRIRLVFSRVEPQGDQSEPGRGRFQRTTISPLEILDPIVADGPPPHRGEVTAGGFIRPLSLGLRSGETVEYYAEAFDSRLPDPNIAATPRRSFRVTESTGGTNSPANASSSEEKKEDGVEEGNQEGDQGEESSQEGKKAGEGEKSGENRSAGNDSESEKNQEESQEENGEEKGQNSTKNSDRPNQNDSGEGGEGDKNKGNNKGQSDRSEEAPSNQLPEKKPEQGGADQPGEKGEKDKGQKEDGGKESSPGGEGEKGENAENGTNDSGQNSSPEQGKKPSDPANSGGENPDSKEDANSPPSGEGKGNPSDQPPSGDEKKSGETPRGENGSGNQESKGNNSPKDAEKNSGEPNNENSSDSHVEPAGNLSPEPPVIPEPIDPETNPGDAFEKILDCCQKAGKIPPELGRGTGSSESNDGKSTDKDVDPDSLATGQGNAPEGTPRQTDRSPKKIPKGTPRERGNVTPNGNLMTAEATDEELKNAKNADPNANIQRDPDRTPSGTAADANSSDQGAKDRPTGDGDSPSGAKSGQPSDLASDQSADGQNSSSNNQSLPDNLDGAAGGPSVNPDAPKKSGSSGGDTPGTASGEPKKGDPSGATPTAGGGPLSGNDPGFSEGKAGMGGPTPSEATPETEVAAADSVNLRYTEKATSLALEYLEDQLKNGPDPELLRQLGWTEDQLRQFWSKWSELEKNAAKLPDESPEKKDYLEDLRNMGLRPSRDSNDWSQGQKDDRFRTRSEEGHSLRTAPPARFEGRFKAYHEGISRQK